MMATPQQTNLGVQDTAQSQTNSQQLQESQKQIQDTPITLINDDNVKSEEKLFSEKIEILKNEVLRERFLRIKQLQNNNHFIRELLTMSLAQTKSYEKELTNVKAQNKALKAELSKNGTRILYEKIADVFEKSKGKKNSIQSIIQEGTDKAIMFHILFFSSFSL